MDQDQHPEEQNPVTPFSPSINDNSEAASPVTVRVGGAAVQPSVVPPTASPVISPTAAPAAPTAIPPAAPPEPPIIPPSPTTEAPGVVVGSDVSSAETVQPFAQPTAPVQPLAPAVVTSGRLQSRLKQPRVRAGLLGLLVLIVGAAAFYFGYYNNPSVIYSQGLSRTGKGYDKLINYVDQQSQAKYKSSTGEGSYKLNAGGTVVDGKLAFKGDGNNGEFSFDIGAAGTRVSVDARAIKASDSADLYLKASGLKGLGSLAGAPDFDAKLAQLDNNWVFIDHTLLESLNSSAEKSTFSPPSRQQVLDELKAFGKVNQQYVFTGNKNKAVMKVVKHIGSEKLDGVKTEHYTVALRKDKVKQYFEAQQAALKASKLNDWLKANNYESGADSLFKELIASTDTIKDSDTFDIWINTSHRILYKVRLTDTKNTKQFVDFGLAYKGGDEYPFFIGGSSPSGDQSTEYKLTATLNSKANSLKLGMQLNGLGLAAGSLQADFTFKPGNESVTVDKPAAAKPLPQVLSDLGYGDLLTELQAMSAGAASGGVSSRAADSKRQVDARALQTQLEAFFAENGYYPSRADMNNAGWLSTHMKSLDRTALADPATPTNYQLAAVPAAHVYAYQPATGSGASCEARDTTCAAFTLTVTYDSPVNGQKTLVIKNLD